MKEDPIDTILGSLSAQEVTEKAEEAKGMETPEELPILPSASPFFIPKCSCRSWSARTGWSS